MDQKKWEKPELTVISNVETSENVLTPQSGGPPLDPGNTDNSSSMFFPES